jgi:hypothetical protein
MLMLEQLDFRTDQALLSLRKPAAMKPALRAWLGETLLIFATLAA